MTLEVVDLERRGRRESVSSHISVDDLEGRTRMESVGICVRVCSVEVVDLGRREGRSV